MESHYDREEGGLEVTFRRVQRTLVLMFACSPPTGAITTRNGSALTFSTIAFTPILHNTHQQPSLLYAHRYRTYLSVARVAIPVSTGTGVPLGSFEFSRGAMAALSLQLDYLRFWIAL